jgi:ParB family transcriptional regulator, chromosome partitioning protein
MTRQQMITLSASRDIPFHKLRLSQSNVRRVKAGVSIGEPANWPGTWPGILPGRP